MAGAGFADSVTVKLKVVEWETLTGGAVTLTVALAVAVPPAPVQVAVNVVFAVKAPEETFVPETPVFQTPAVPDLVTSQEVALVEVQVMLDAEPDVTVVGLAEIFTVG